jgi:hypothetical protein
MAGRHHAAAYTPPSLSKTQTPVRKRNRRLAAAAPRTSAPRACWHNDSGDDSLKGMAARLQRLWSWHRANEFTHRLRTRARSERRGVAVVMRPIWIILCVSAVVGGLLFLCCGGLAYFGLQIVSDQVRVELEDHPMLVQHLGKIEQFQTDLWASLAEDHDDVWVYRVRGAKGEGKVIAMHITVSDDREEIIWAVLVMPDGQRIDLVP